MPGGSHYPERPSRILSRLKAVLTITMRSVTLGQLRLSITPPGPRQRYFDIDFQWAAIFGLHVGAV